MSTTAKNAGIFTHWSRWTTKGGSRSRAGTLEDNDLNRIKNAKVTVFIKPERKPFVSFRLIFILTSRFPEDNNKTTLFE